MIDFLMIATKSTKRGVIEIYPKFIIKKSEDLMIRGRDFYAIWVEEKQLWSTDEQDALNIIDKELDLYTKKNKDRFDSDVRVLHMWDAESGMIDSWHKYCQKQMRDNFHMLDERIIFSNMETKKEDYASKRLNYPLEQTDISSYDELMSTLYSEEERRKIEWAIGSVVQGDSKYIQKFLVLYGSAGTGKSTILNIIQQLFEGYYSVFDAKALGSSNNTFALEAFKTNPLVAIQHDGDLSRIEDNTRLNSLVSHELMTVNEKFKSTYANRFKCFLFMGTNKPVRITDSKSGLIRRLIDVQPTGDKLSMTDYQRIVSRIKFELPGIAYHCRSVYQSDPSRYDDYIPIKMIGASNDFYNFISDAYFAFCKDGSMTLKSAWEKYTRYCSEAKVTYPYTQRAFKEELKNYFEDYKDRYTLADGTRVRSYFINFKKDKFNAEECDEPPDNSYVIQWDGTVSAFDERYKDCRAQYAKKDGTPKCQWAKVETTLKDLDTEKLHYVKVPENHIVIDFDISDENGDKCLELNLREANKWPPTYAEISRSGGGIHLHYIYTGDVSLLKPMFDDHIEVKVYKGGSALRRKRTLFNAMAIATISSGLPLKGEKKKVVTDEKVKSEMGIRRLIERNLRKEIHSNTTQSVSFIKKILDDAYADGLDYDVRDMYNDILTFAAKSSNQKSKCIDMVCQMKLVSENHTEDTSFDKEESIYFFDIEVFPNLLLICYKRAGEKYPILTLFNPDPDVVKKLFELKLVGFNCRKYDNHILFARGYLGYSIEQCYEVSKGIIDKDRNCFFGKAYNISYTDIYDFSSVKQSLKKFEIELGIHHQELGLPWDQPVDVALWDKVAEYCKYDVAATEATFNALSQDYNARLMLADIAEMTPNTTTNTLTTKLITDGNDIHDELNWRDLSKPVTEMPPDMYQFLMDAFPEMVMFNDRPKKSLLPFFEGYRFEFGKSYYRGELVGEGGYVYSEPGIYYNVALLDIASMHPHSIITEYLFGSYTKRYKDLVDMRIAIKHKDYDHARKMFDGKLEPYLKDESSAKMLSKVLKIPINSTYGLTSAGFDNALKDPRNIDNIVAKRGALFMIDLKNEVQDLEYTVAHIKTDSIKIPEADDEIIDFVTEFGKDYGYTFEHEATYERMCLVNDAVYIARLQDGTWTATGTQFKVPYVFKTLFSHEPIEFKDLCETRSVKSAMVLDMNEDLSEGDHNYRFVGKVGLFCPMKPGSGGGILLREQDGKYNAVTGTKGYRWMESEVVKNLGLEDQIDRSYYDKLADEAIATINKFGDFKKFTEV